MFEKWVKNAVAGYKGVSGPRGNANAFKHGLSSGSGNYPHESGKEATAHKHGLAAMDKKRKQNRLPRSRAAKRFRREFYKSLVADAGGAENVTAAKKYMAELISHDAVWLNKMIEARDNLLRAKPSYLQNIAALSKLDSYIRPVINSISTALDRFGYEKAVPMPKSLEDLFNEPAESEPDTESEEDA